MTEASKKWYNEKKEEKEKEMLKEIVTEMCDVCCKDCPAPIPRTMYLTKTGIKYIIRHHIECNPIWYAQNFLEIKQ